MRPDQRLPIRGEADLLAARRVVRDLAETLGFGDVQRIEIATAVSEISRNILNYAGEGEMTFAVVREGARTGLQVRAQDHGPGIPDLTLAMSDGYSTGNGLGLGLPGARRLMDTFEITSDPTGTRITMAKWRRAW